jgi:hypothetical protein
MLRSRSRAVRIDETSRIVFPRDLSFHKYARHRRHCYRYLVNRTYTSPKSFPKCIRNESERQDSSPFKYTITVSLQGHVAKIRSPQLAHHKSLRHRFHKPINVVFPEFILRVYQMRGDIFSINRIPARSLPINNPNHVVSAHKNIETAQIAVRESRRTPVLIVQIDEFPDKFVIVGLYILSQVTVKCPNVLERAKPPSITRHSAIVERTAVDATNQILVAVRSQSAHWLRRGGSCCQCIAAMVLVRLVATTLHAQFQWQTCCCKIYA